MASIHESILEQIEVYKEENEKFMDKGVKASAARARKALGEIGITGAESSLKVMNEVTVKNVYPANTFPNMHF